MWHRLSVLEVLVALAWVQGQNGLTDLKKEINVLRNNQSSSGLLPQSPSFSTMQ